MLILSINQLPQFSSIHSGIWIYVRFSFWLRINYQDHALYIKQVVMQEKNQQATLEEVRKVAWEASQKFNDIHSDRLEAFMEVGLHAKP